MMIMKMSRTVLFTLCCLFLAKTSLATAQQQNEEQDDHEGSSRAGRLRGSTNASQLEQQRQLNQNHYVEINWITCGKCGVHGQCKQVHYKSNGYKEITDCRCDDGYLSKGIDSGDSQCKTPCQHANCDTDEGDECVPDGVDSYCKFSGVTIKSVTNGFKDQYWLEKGTEVDVVDKHLNGRSTILDVKKTINNDIKNRNKKIYYDGEWQSATSTLDEIGFPNHGRQFLLGKTGAHNDGK